MPWPEGHAVADDRSLELGGRAAPVSLGLRPAAASRLLGLALELGPQAPVHFGRSPEVAGTGHGSPGYWDERAPVRPRGGASGPEHGETPSDSVRPRGLLLHSVAHRSLSAISGWDQADPGSEVCGPAACTSSIWNRRAASAATE